MTFRKRFCFFLLVITCLPAIHHRYRLVLNLKSLWQTCCLNLNGSWRSSRMSKASLTHYYRSLMFLEAAQDSSSTHSHGLSVYYVVLYIFPFRLKIHRWPVIILADSTMYIRAAGDMPFPTGSTLPYPGEVDRKHEGHRGRATYWHGCGSLRLSQHSFADRADGWRLEPDIPLCRRQDLHPVAQKWDACWYGNVGKVQSLTLH